VEIPIPAGLVQDTPDFSAFLDAAAAKIGLRPGVIAYCGPRRQIRTALILAMLGETVTEIRETGALPDPDAIYLVDDAAFRSPRFEFTDGPAGQVRSGPAADEG
jgi:hypothetical protein